MAMKSLKENPFDANERDERELILMSHWLGTSFSIP
jgi:hypothetical protein